MTAVAVVGCGAVAQLYYGPALGRLERSGALRVTAVHDPAPDAVHRFRTHLTGARSAPDLGALLATGPDVVIVASPPALHAHHVVAALEAGADVMCEKPLATDAESGRAMVEAAARTGRQLAVGMVRRQLPATRAVRRLVRSGALGEIRSVECFEGGPFTWPVTSPTYFRPVDGNGGVLQDIGTHCLDLLTWWFGAPTSLAYADDAMGGVEANCDLRLGFGAATARVRLSRDWARPNRYRIEGTRGRIEWEVNEGRRLRVELADGPLGDLDALDRDPEGADRPVGDFHDAFAAQLLALAEGAWDRLVPAGEALEVLDLVDRCYRHRCPMPMPWLGGDGLP